MTRKSLLAFGAFLLTAIAVISAIFGTIAIPQMWIKWAALISVVIFAIIGALFYLRGRKYDNAVEVLLRHIKQVTPLFEIFEVRYLNSEAEFRDVWEASQAIYGDDNVPWDTAVSWWRCYPQGVCCLFGPPGIVGYFSMWPVKKMTFKELRDGRRHERQLHSQSIAGKSQSEPRAYWHITNIVIMKNFKRTRAVNTLLSWAMRNWLRSGNLAPIINVTAAAHSSEGEALLRRCGFAKSKAANETPDHHSIYLNVLRLEDLKRLVNHLFPEQTDLHLE